MSFNSQLFINGKILWFNYSQRRTLTQTIEINLQRRRTFLDCFKNNMKKVAIIDSPNFIDYNWMDNSVPFLFFDL